MNPSEGEKGFPSSLALSPGKRRGKKKRSKTRIPAKMMVGVEGGSGTGKKQE